MSTTLTKINPSYSFIDLIDSTSCIGDSYNVILNNFVSLLSANLKMSNNKYENYIYTDFQSLSSKMVSMMYNINKIDYLTESTYSLVQVMSSGWAYKEFSVYYPWIIDLPTYVATPAAYVGEVNDWLNKNFPSEKFAEGQIINLFISSSYINTFEFIFKGSYAENCSPTAHSDNKLSCDGCGGDKRNAGCNHDHKGRHWCDNAYSYCQQPDLMSASETFACQGTTLDTYRYSNVVGLYNSGNNGYLEISYEKQGIEDKFLARIIKIKLQIKKDPFGSLFWDIK